MKNNNNIEIEKTKLNIKKELFFNDLSKLFELLLIVIVLSSLFGYAGYIYSLDNNLDIKHGIIFGILFPLGLSLLETLEFKKIFIYILYTIIYVGVVDYIPTLIGIVILFLLMILLISYSIYIIKKDRTDEIDFQYRLQNIKSTPKVNIDNNIEKESFLEDNDLEYECERCFKKISEEEFYANDGMCEDCYIDTHIDENGNFHDDEFF